MARTNRTIRGPVDLIARIMCAGHVAGTGLVAAACGNCQREAVIVTEQLEALRITIVQEPAKD